MLDPDVVQESLDLLSVVPSVLEGRLSSYIPQWSAAYDNFVDAETGVPISFDLSKPYDADILVRHTCGGSNLSINLLKKLVLQDSITDLLRQRIENIGRPFGAVHIRNTDHQSHYRPIIDQMAGSILIPVFVAMDSLNCRQYCETVFGRDNVIHFSTLPDQESPIHSNKNFRSAFERNSEAILDLLTSALSNEYYKIPLKRDDHLEWYSGFSNLAENLMRNSDILISLLGQTASAKVIVEKVSAWQNPNPGLRAY
ncbi:hypothetical protein MKK88_24215 [Methylobacterium sp. E-005]|uniref:hypothetical protein n=1 Tax=Methylobacterium sp. E-005 TaxID=2836549 RepID=UPI001FB9F41A|nr:hypothetical protein [Methylobacterium sp. E-005]MCJ2089066.1 hypothetical protein [Methylobacterium sp. E-005]